MLSATFCSETQKMPRPVIQVEDVKMMKSFASFWIHVFHVHVCAELPESKLPIIP